VAFAPCLAVVYTFLPIKVLPLLFRGVISSLPPCYIGKYTMTSPYRREELIADTATLVYLLSVYNRQASEIICVQTGNGNAAKCKGSAARTDL
jgi:hypothetical protein